MTLMQEVYLLLYCTLSHATRVRARDRSARETHSSKSCSKRATALAAITARAATHSQALGPRVAHCTLVTRGPRQATPRLTFPGCGLLGARTSVARSRLGAPARIGRCAAAGLPGLHVSVCPWLREPCAPRVAVATNEVTPRKQWRTSRPRGVERALRSRDAGQIVTCERQRYSHNFAGGANGFFLPGTGNRGPRISPEGRGGRFHTSEP